MCGLTRGGRCCLGGSRLLLRHGKCPGRGEARMQIERRTGDEHVDFEPQHAHRLTLFDTVDGAEGHVRSVDDGDAAAALHLDGLIGAHECRGVLIQAEANGKGVVRERGEEPAEAVALAEMLVDDEAVGEAEPRSKAHAAGDHRGALVTCGNHVLREDAGAALVPPTVTPCALRRRMSLATGVPPRSVVSRSWLPPVKNMPLASWRRSRRPRS